MTPAPDDVRAARRRIADRVRLTPLVASEWLARETGARVSLKLESLQLTGSFKIRGALNAAMRLAPGTRVVTASAGNHGHAIARAAAQFGLDATVFVPADAPETKLRAMQRYAAHIDRRSSDYDEAEARAREHASRSGATYVSPYNHPDVIAGGGTVALEVLEAAPDVDVIVVPVGGGGLISGIAVALDAQREVRIVGVEAEASTAFGASLAAGRIVTIVPRATLADGLSGNLEPGAITFGIVQRHVERIVTVTEEELSAAMRGLASEERVVAEGAGAAATAAVLAGKIGDARHAVAIVSGGNVDLSTFAAVINGT